jgi:hypothetical protein
MAGKAGEVTVERAGASERQIKDQAAKKVCVKSEDWPHFPFPPFSLSRIPVFPQTVAPRTPKGLRGNFVRREKTIKKSDAIRW